MDGPASNLLHAWIAMRGRNNVAGAVLEADSYDMASWELLMWGIEAADPPQPANTLMEEQ